MTLKEMMERRTAIYETEIGAAKNDEELDTLQRELRKLDLTIAEEERKNAEMANERTAAVTSEIPGVVGAAVIEPENRKSENREEIEIRSFSNYVKRECGIKIEKRDGEQDFNMTNNGALIPTTIVNMVISAVKEMCPIFEKATVFNVKGTLKVPVYGLANTTHDITVGYQTEFTDITADAGKFTSVDLSGFLAGALSLVGKSVINNSAIDVTGFVVREMAKKIAIFLEKELLVGTADKATGALATTTQLKAGSTSAISADNLIELQTKIPTAYQANACWTMNPATFTALKKLKDGNGVYLIQNDFSSGFPYRILGKPVYLSDNMPVIASAAKTILYGDYSGLAVNLREDISIQLLQEKYATMHAIGIVSWFEFDSDVVDHQKLATLVMSTL